MSKINGKKIFLFVILIIIGIILVNTKIPESVNQFSWRVTNQTLTKLELPTYPDDQKTPIEISGELVFASILVILPISVIGGIWFAKLSFELLYGQYSSIPVFNFPLYVNKIIGVLCFIVFIYSFYEQYKWIDKIFSIKPVQTNDKDLLKFI